MAVLEGRPSFEELLQQFTQQLQETHDAEVAYWKSQTPQPPTPSGGANIQMPEADPPKLGESPGDNVPDDSPDSPDTPKQAPSSQALLQYDAADMMKPQASEQQEQQKSQRKSRSKSRFGKAQSDEGEEHIKPHRTYTSFDKFSYILDRWISKRRSQAIALAGSMLFSVLVFGVLWAVFFAEEDYNILENILEGCWLAWCFMADPGTHADVDDVFGQPKRILAATIAATGIIFMATIVGMVADTIRQKMDMLRQGKSKVVEKHHSLILGWTEKAVSIIEELCNANESEGGGIIVVLSHKPKEAIEIEFAAKFPPKFRKGTRVIFRTGSPMVIADLIKVGAPSARSTIILSNDGDVDNSDAEVLRVILSLKALPYECEGHIVVEVRDINFKPMVRMVGGESAEPLVSNDVLGRLMLNACRQPGLSKVYEALLGFEGDEFYMEEWPELVGINFGNLIERFPDAIPIGIYNANKELEVNPASDRAIEEGEQIFVIAEDDDSYRAEQARQIEEGSAPSVAQDKLRPAKILFCGWRRDMRDIIVYLDDTLQPGSQIHMITAHVPLHLRTERLADLGLDVNKLRNVVLVHHYGNPSVQRRMEVLPIAQFSSCMIFADEAFEGDTLIADSQSLAALLLFRTLQMQERVGGDETSKQTGKSALSRTVRACPVICEVLDPLTQKLIGQNDYLQKAAEFCQTNKITAQMLAMVGENRSVNVLFDELLGSGGNSINVYPSSQYVTSGESVSFWTLAKRATKRREILIGYKTKDHEILINPRDKTVAKTWDEFDAVVISQTSKPRSSQGALTKPKSSIGKRTSMKALLQSGYSDVSADNTDLASENEQLKAELKRMYAEYDSLKTEVMEVTQASLGNNLNGFQNMVDGLADVDPKKAQVKKKKKVPLDKPTLSQGVEIR